MGAPVTPAESSTAASVALRRFAFDLQQVRLADGEPPYATLVRRMNREFSKATISRVLNGARPSWRFTSCFLAACGVSESAIAQTWRPKWTALQNALRPLDPSPARETTDGSGAECTICGVWATNTLRHAAYHRQRGDLSASRA